jgi:hypothetical protein
VRGFYRFSWLIITIYHDYGKSAPFWGYGFRDKTPMAPGGGALVDENERPFMYQ